MTAETAEVQEGELLWTPRPEFAHASQIADFMRWLAEHEDRRFVSYDALWRWSIEEVETFWALIWRYFGVQSTAPYEQVLEGDGIAQARWFRGSLVNYTEHLLRHERTAAATEVVFHHASETRPLASMTWAELGRQVRIVATQLRGLGLRPGDRVVSYMPNIPETAVAMMAATAIGAIWSSAAPELGARAVVERFAQIEPTLMFAADGYRFAGRDFPRENEVRQIAAGLPSLRHLVWLPYLQARAPYPDDPRAVPWSFLLDHADVAPEDFSFERVPYDHPLWILYSSGATGLPKAIVHSHVGALVEHLKVMHFHLNLRPGSVMLFYTTTSWMMWNILLAALHAGSAAVLYDGSPVHPGPEVLWGLAQQTGTTCLGASPGFLHLTQRAGLRPNACFDLSKVEAIVLSGAPCSPELFAWCYRNVKRDVWVASQSGGTELCSAFVGAVPLLPVHAGEIQARLLGMDVRAWSESGEELQDELGEMVITRPFPSMPIGFWNDEGGRRYSEAYFDAYPGVWRHGDFIRFNARGGCYIQGRSDSTLNRNGVRIGTSEVYRALGHFPEVLDALIVCCDLTGGRFFMPLFLKLRPGCALDPALRDRICARLRQDCSPRHVPDRIYAVSEIPYTLTGKKMEVPVRKILTGWPLEAVASRETMLNRRAIDFYVRFAEESIDYPWRLARGPADRPLDS